MNLIITLFICSQAEYVIESLIQTNRISTYNPPWLQRFMDTQVGGNDLLTAAKTAQSFNDNLEHEVRVANDLEPIPHLGEFPTTMKFDPTGDHSASASSKLEDKIKQMREEVAEESVFKVGWQEDDQLYNRIIEHMIELDAEEQPEFLLKILKNEMRSNRGRVVQRLKEILQLITDEVLAIPLEKLYEECIRANMEMEIEEVFRDELNISLDPIKNGEIGEVEQLVEELQYDDQLEQTEEQQQIALPVEYQIVLRRDLPEHDNKLHSVESVPVNKLHITSDQTVEDKNKMVIRQYTMKLEDLFIAREQEDQESEEQQAQEQSEEKQISEEQQVQAQSEEPQVSEEQVIQEDQHSTEEQQQQQQSEEQFQPGPRELFRNPSVPFDPIQEIISNGGFVPHEMFNPQHRDDMFDSQFIPLQPGEVAYQQRPIIPHEAFNPIHPDDQYNVYGEKKIEKDQYFHYNHGTPANGTERQDDVAQSINIVQGDAEMQSINIQMDPVEMQSINIQFDETQAEQHKQQELYHKYRNQQHFINRGSFHYPNDPQYPNIHSVSDSSAPYYYEGYYTGDVPSNPYQMYQPPLEEVVVGEEIVQVSEEIVAVNGSGEEAGIEIGENATEEQGQVEVNDGEIVGEESALQRQKEGEEAQPEEVQKEGEDANSGNEEGQVRGGSEETQQPEETQQLSEEPKEEEKQIQGGEENQSSGEQKEDEAVSQEGTPEETQQVELESQGEEKPSGECGKGESQEQIEQEEPVEPRINWEEIPDEEIEYIISRLIHPKFYDSRHPDYDPYDPRNIVFTDIHIQRSAQYIQLKHPLFYLPGEGPYSKLSRCQTPEDLLDQIQPEDIRQLVSEWKRRGHGSNTQSKESSTIYKQFQEPLRQAPVEDTFSPQAPPAKKHQSTTEPYEFTDEDFASSSPRDIGKFGKKRQARAIGVDPNDPRAIPNFNPEKSSFQGNNEYVSDNPILKSIQGAKMQQEERGDYQLQNPDEFHKPPSFDDDRPYRTGRDGKPLRRQRDWQGYDEYDEYDQYDQYDEYDDYGQYDQYDEDYGYRPDHLRRTTRRSNEDRDGDGIPDRYEDDDYGGRIGSHRDNERYGQEGDYVNRRYRDDERYGYVGYPPYYRRRRRGRTADDLEEIPLEKTFERELRRSKQDLRNRKRPKNNDEQEPHIEEFHIYHDLDNYSQARGVNDKRSREERAMQDPNYSPGKKDGSPRIKDTSDKNVDDYPRRDQREDKDEMDSSGLAFAKSLKEQGRQKRNKKLQEEQLKQLGVKKELSNNGSNKNKKVKKQKKSENSGEMPELKEHKDKDTQQSKDVEIDKETSQNENKQQSKYKVEGLAANKSNNINNSDSLIQPQSKQTTKKEMSRANEIEEPDTRHQAKNNAEKSQENKEFGKEEPLVNKNKKAKTLLQMPDESCNYLDGRSKTYTCTQCNATQSYIMNDDSWYLIGLAKGYKKEFHTVFKLLKELMNPQQLYTSFGVQDRICFSSQEKQQVNVSKIVKLFSGKPFNSTFVQFPEMLKMSYFQLMFHNSQFYEFELEIDDNTIMVDKSGMKISKVHIIWQSEQMQLGYSGVIDLHNVQRKFDYKYQIDEDCVNEHLKLYLHFPYDYEHSVVMLGSLFSQEYVDIYQQYLLSQLNDPARWVAVQFKSRQCTNAREYGLSLQQQ